MNGLKSFVVVALFGMIGCISDDGEDVIGGEVPVVDDAGKDVSAATCSPTNYAWRYFKKDSSSICVYGAFNTTCNNRVSVNIAEYNSWNGTRLRLTGSGLQPSTARTGRVCAYACLPSPSSSYYYKIDLWDDAGIKLYQDWVTGNSIPDPQKYSSSSLITYPPFPSDCPI